MKTLCKFGTHRVLEPSNSLPQAAIRIDATPRAYDNECLIDVDTLNIDSASFHQIKTACNQDIDAMKTMILDIVNRQGKMQNPVTKSGGMLIGRVKQVGKDFHDQSLTIGTPIATLVSLSLTPLFIEDILAINMSNEQVSIKGQAIVFDSGIYAKIPSDLNEKLVLAALDVAGAPAQIKKLAKKNDTVLIIGAAGKSGLLCAYQARVNVGEQGTVIALVNEPEQKELLTSLGYCDHIILEDALDAVSVYHKVADLTNNELADLTINVVNIDNTEMTAILSTKEQGTVYFFSMATSFTKAALGAEGVGKDLTMIIGNGYTKGHATLTLNLLKENQALYDIFMSRYA